MSRRLGEYVPLSVDYPDDDAIMAVPPLAELLFLRCLALARRLKSDGYLTEPQLLHRAGARIGNTRALLAYKDQLVSVGLLEKVDGGYIIRAYLKWNKSAEELGRELARDRQRKRSDRQMSAGNPADSTRNPDGLPSESNGSPEPENRIPASRAPAYASARAGDRTVPDRTQPQPALAEVVTTPGGSHGPPVENPGFDSFAADAHGPPASRRPDLPACQGCGAVLDPDGTCFACREPQPAATTEATR